MFHQTILNQQVAPKYNLCRQFRKSCPNGSCSGTVCPSFIPRYHADFRAYLPDHQQCPCLYSTQPIHTRCQRAFDWRQCGRCGDTGGFSGKSYYLSRIYAPHFRRRQALSLTIFRNQLYISGDSSGCNVRSDVIGRCYVTA